jgi:tetratricopeptide (TPR) repeat protein
LSTNNTLKGYALFEEAYNLCKPLYEGNANPNMVIPLYISTLQYLSYCELIERKYGDAYPHLTEFCHLTQQLPTTNDEQKKTIAETYGNTSYAAIMLKKYAEAEEFARKAISILPSQSVSVTYLAAALLFQGKYNEAKVIYIRYKEELKDSFLDDFKQFAEAGAIPKKREKDVETIKKMLEE